MAGSRARRLGIRDRLGQLTYRGACRLMGDGDEGPPRLLRGNRLDVDIVEGVRFTADAFQAQMFDPDLRQQVQVEILETPSKPQGLSLSCSVCPGRCDHVAAALMVSLEHKLPLGLSAPPDPNEPIENLTEQELLRRALANREERAVAEPMRIKPVNDAVPWTDYTVTNKESGKSYRVSLRGREAGESYCSCPDFRTNHLGTCKHILHVLRKIEKKFPPKQLARPYRRKNLSLRVDYGPQVGLRFNLPTDLTDDARRLLGPLAEATTDQADDILRRVRKLEAAGYPVHVYPDAEEFIQHRLMRKRLEEAVAEIRQNPAQHRLRKELLKTELLPYQLDGIAFSVGAGRAVLADDMGLGKTIQGIGVAELLAQLADIKRVLVVCPTSLKSQWRNEIGRFSDRSSQIVIGSAADRVAHYRSDAFFTICNYEQVLRDQLTIESTPWDLIILDEGQRIKNWESRTSQVIKTLRSPYALVLSGTPLENRLEELYTVVSFIDDRRLGPAYRFFHRHRMVDDRGRVEGYRKLDELRETLKPVLLRRTRGAVIGELPERTTEIVRIRPTDEQAVLSNEHMARAAQIAAKRHLTEMDLLRLQKHLLMARMAADGTFLVDKEYPGFSSKLERLRELLESLAEESDRKIVLFSEWTRMLDAIEPLFKKLGMRFVRLDGKVPQKQRQHVVHEFQTNPECRAIIMSNAGTTGLNLQAANTVINVDLPWNPAVLEQRIARAHRMGQKRPVQVYLLVTEDTLEERLLQTLSAKHDLALAALDVDSEVTEVELRSGMEELKRRLEKLLGEKPVTPVDRSQQQAVEQETAAIAARRDKVAAAGGELLGAALKLLGELVPRDDAPDATVVSQVRTGLEQCTERDATGRPQLRFTLPDDGALEGLAATLAKLLVGK